MRQVTIRRRTPGTGLISADLASGAVTKISSIFKSGIIYKPFDVKEERKYLPLITEIDPEARNWRKLADDYWREFEIKVDEDGPILNITMKEDGEPMNIKDFVTYCFAMGHPRVGADEADMKARSLDFHIYDPDVAKERQFAGIQIRKEAYQTFAVLASDDAGHEVLRKVLRMRKINPDFMTKMDVENSINEIVQSEPEEFIKIAGDRTLKIKALIEEFVEKNILNRVGRIS